MQTCPPVLTVQSVIALLWVSVRLDLGGERGQGQGLRASPQLLLVTRGRRDLWRISFGVVLVVRYVGAQRKRHARLYSGGKQRPKALIY